MKRDKRILRLWSSGKYSYDEIAAKVRCTKGVVAGVVHRDRARRPAVAGSGGKVRDTESAPSHQFVVVGAATGRFSKHPKAIRQQAKDFLRWRERQMANV